MSQLDQPDYAIPLSIATQLQDIAVKGLTGDPAQRAAARLWIDLFISDNLPAIVMLLIQNAGVIDTRLTDLLTLEAALDWRKHLDKSRGLEELRDERAVLTRRLEIVNKHLEVYEVPHVDG